jgi:hypothetical protein
MSRLPFRACLALAGLCTCLAAQGVEPPKKSFHIWVQDLDHNKVEPQHSLSLDLSVTISGIEAPGSAQSRSTSKPDAAGKITTTDHYRLVAQSASGDNAVFTAQTAAATATKKYPDPRIAQFQCNGAKETTYFVKGESLGCPAPDGNCPAGRQCFDPARIGDQFPLGKGMNVGIANVGSQRVLVFGSQIHGGSPFKVSF